MFPAHDIDADSAMGGSVVTDDRISETEEVSECVHNLRKSKQFCMKN